MKRYILVGNYNNGIRYVIDSYDSQAKARLFADIAVRHDARRSGKGARLRVHICDALLTISNETKRGTRRAKR